MNTPSTSKRAKQEHAHTTKIPRPKWDTASQEMLEDTASPSLAITTRGMKRRHQSQPNDRVKLQKTAKSEDKNSALNAPENPSKSGSPVPTPASPRPRRRSSSEPSVVMSTLAGEGTVTLSDRAARYKRRSSGSMEDSAGLESGKVSKSRTVEGVAEDEENSATKVIKKPVRRDSGSKSRRKSRRRSSFVLGRISKVAPIVQDVSLDVPADLPPDRRLAKLSSAVTEYTLSKLQEEFGDVEGFQQLQVQAREAVRSAVERMEATDTFKQATLSARLTPNPVNEQVNRNVHYISSYMERLKTEYETWKSMLVDREQKLVEAESAVEAIQSHPLTSQPERGLTAQQVSFLSARPRYSNILADLNTQREDAVLAVNDIVTTVSSLEHVQAVASKLYSDTAADIYKATFAEIASQEPQTLLSAVLEYKEEEPTECFA